MSLRFVHFPFVKLTVIFTVGILLGEFYSFPIKWVLGIGVGFSLFLILDYLRLLSIPFKWRFLSSIFGTVPIICLGIFMNHDANKSSRISQQAKVLNAEDKLIFELTELPSERSNSIRLFGHVTNLEFSGPEFQLVVYAKPNAEKNAQQLNPGDQLLFDSENINRISRPQNPGEFNYAEFMAKKGFYYQGYLEPNDWVLFDKNTSFSPYRTAQKLRKKLLALLAEMRPDERAVAEALLLGYKDHLSEDTKQDYARSGALHVLAVSGLHVGIIYLILSRLLSFLSHYRYGRISRIILLLLGLWAYALITGLPPSVMRAALMFSVITIGSNLRKPNSVYHNVMISAFILLWFKPNLLFDVGFQLSYCAVLGIISWQPSIGKWLDFKNKIANSAWQIISVSLAAQLAVLPLALFYFNQFPVLFPITNLIVIPAATVILFSGMALFLSSLFGGQIQRFVLYEFQDFLSFVNDSISFISSFSFAAISDLFISQTSALLLALAILSITMFWLHKFRIMLWISLGSLLFGTVLSTLKWHSKAHETDLVVFDTGASPAIGIANYNSAFLICNVDKPEDLEYSTLGFFNSWNHGFSDVKCLQLDSLKNSKILTDKLKIEWPFVMVDTNMVQFHNKQWLPSNADLHVVSNYKIPYQIDSLYAECVFTSNIYKQKLLEKKPNFVQSHFVRQQGAFVLNGKE